MNILIQQTKAFPHRANSFYWFYAQLTEWLTAHGVDSKLYFSYLELADSEFENGLLLPDHYSQFYTPRNIEAICRFIIDKQIDVILDYSMSSPEIHANITSKSKKEIPESKYAR